MSAFSIAVDTLFRDSNLAVDAVYTPAGGSPIPCRAMPDQPEVSVSVDRGMYVSATSIFRVRTSEVPASKSGDTLAIVGGASYVVQGVPRRDPHRLVWTLDTHPA